MFLRDQPLSNVPTYGEPLSEPNEPLVACQSGLAVREKPALWQGGAISSGEASVAAEPHPRCLEGHLRRPHFDFGLSDRTNGMVDHDRNQALHANGGTRQFGLALELGRDDRRRRDTELFKGDGIADAA